MSARGAYKKIGVLGGTFDPVHIGHLRPALEVKAALALDEMRLVPCHLTPHRPQPARTTALRAQMTASAVQGLEGFVVDEREMHRDGPSYTVDTLASMREDKPGAALYFLLGVDSLNGLDSWHCWQDLLSLSHLVLMRRPGYTLNAFASALVDECGSTPERAATCQAGCLLSVDTTELRVSSTALRTLLAAGGDPHFLVPDSVRTLLLNRNDYQDCHD